MTSFVGRLQNILVSKWFAVVLIFLPLSCLSIFPIANASAAACSASWDISAVDGLKSNYQLGESINGDVKFTISNAAGEPRVIQQILVGIADQTGKVYDFTCIYNGQPKECPEFTTGSGSFSLKNPDTSGSYNIIANQDANYSCQSAHISSTGARIIATITVSASKADEKSVAPTTPPPPPPTKENTTTSSSGGGATQDEVWSKVGSAIQFIIIVCAIGLAVFLLIRLVQWINEVKKRDESFERVCKAIEKYKLPIRTNNERAIQVGLYEYLIKSFPMIKMEQQTEDRDRPDLVIKHIAIEIKAPTRNTSLENLLPKCMKYGKFYNKIIFVLFAREYSESKFEQVKEEIHKNYPKLTARFIPK